MPGSGRKNQYTPHRHPSRHRQRNRNQSSFFSASPPRADNLHPWVSRESSQPKRLVRDSTSSRSDQLSDTSSTSPSSTPSITPTSSSSSTPTLTPTISPEKKDNQTKIPNYHDLDRVRHRLFSGPKDQVNNQGDIENLKWNRRSDQSGSIKPTNMHGPSQSHSSLGSYRQNRLRMDNPGSQAQNLNQAQSLNRGWDRNRRRSGEMDRNRRRSREMDRNRNWTSYRSEIKSVSPGRPQLSPSSSHDSDSVESSTGDSLLSSSTESIDSDNLVPRLNLTSENDISDSESERSPRPRIDSETKGTHLLIRLLQVSGHKLNRPFEHYVDLGFGDRIFYEANRRQLLPLQSSLLDLGHKNLPGCLNIKGHRLPRSLGQSRVDLITCYMVFHHLTHPHLIISELTRIIKPGGYLFIREHDVDERFESNLTAYLDLMHMMEFVRHGINVDQRLTKFYRRYWSRSKLNQSLVRAGFQLVASQQYPDRYNPQRFYHALYQFDPYLVDKIDNCISSPKPTNYCAAKLNLISWLRRQRRMVKSPRLSQIKIKNPKLNSTNRSATSSDPGPSPTPTPGPSPTPSPGTGQPQPPKSPQPTKPPQPTKSPQSPQSPQPTKLPKLPKSPKSTTSNDISQKHIPFYNYYLWFYHQVESKFKLNQTILDQIMDLSINDLDFYSQLVGAIPAEWVAPAKYQVHRAPEFPSAQHPDTSPRSKISPRGRSSPRSQKLLQPTGERTSPRAGQNKKGKSQLKTLAQQKKHKWVRPRSMSSPPTSPYLPEVEALSHDPATIFIQRPNSPDYINT